MQVVIKQKYFTVGAKFEIKTTEGQTVFFAERQWDRFMGNVVLFDKNGHPLRACSQNLRRCLLPGFQSLIRAAMRFVASTRNYLFFVSVAPSPHMAI